MKGQAEIIAMRVSGESPKFVFINDYPCPSKLLDGGPFATVCTHGEAIAGMDMRYVAGLGVSISSPSEARARRLFERAIEFDAVAVAASHIPPNTKCTDPPGWSDVYHRPVNSPKEIPYVPVS